MKFEGSLTLPSLLRAPVGGSRALLPLTGKFLTEKQRITSIVNFRHSLPKPRHRPQRLSSGNRFRMDRRPGAPNRGISAAYFTVGILNILLPHNPSKDQHRMSPYLLLLSLPSSHAVQHDHSQLITSRIAMLTYNAEALWDDPL